MIKAFLKLIVLLSVWMLLEGHHYNEDMSLKCVLMPRKCKREIAKEEENVYERDSDKNSDDVYVRYQPEF